jgi:hypothetical protein
MTSCIRVMLCGLLGFLSLCGLHWLHWLRCLFPLFACPCRYLSADDNNLSGTLCSCFSTLTALNSFYVAGNLFSGTIPTTFSNMANLQCVRGQLMLAGGAQYLGLTRSCWWKCVGRVGLGCVFGVYVSQVPEQLPPVRVVVRAHLLHPDPSAVCVTVHPADPLPHLLVCVGVCADCWACGRTG